MVSFPKVPTFPPARTAEQRQKQLAMGITPDFGRGANGGTSPLPQGATWMPHVGRRQRMRNFDRAWAKFENICASDAHYQATRERLLDWLVETDTPMPELAAKAIVHASLVKSEEHAEEIRRNPQGRPMVEGTDWVDEINTALNQWEQNKSASSEGDGLEIPPAPPEEMPDAT